MLVQLSETIVQQSLWLSAMEKLGSDNLTVKTDWEIWTRMLDVTIHH